jgi:SAM-dependent methyltransferase
MKVMYVWHACASEGLDSMKRNQEWKHGILARPVKHMNRYTQISDGSSWIGESEDYFVKDDLGIVRTKGSFGPSLEFHSRMEKGAALRELQHQYLHLCYWDTIYYKRAIAEFLKEVNPEEKIAADIGCGDGRFTELLIKLGFDKVVAIDADLRPLYSLARHAEEKGFRDKLLLIQGNIEHVLLKEEKIDVALTIGVLYYLNERFEDALENVTRIVKPGGILIGAEPDIEGAMLKDLLFGSISEYLQVLSERTFIETVNGEKFRFRVFSHDELVAIYEKAGLQIIDHHCISLFPYILRIGMVRGQFQMNQVAAVEAEIRRSFEFLDQNGHFAKHIIWKTQKKKS